MADMKEGVVETKDRADKADSRDFRHGRYGGPVETRDRADKEEGDSSILLWVYISTSSII
jgi:hypothetical protein